MTRQFGAFCRNNKKIARRGALPTLIYTLKLYVPRGSFFWGRGQSPHFFCFFGLKFSCETNDCNSSIGINRNSNRGNGYHGANTSPNLRIPFGTKLPIGIKKQRVKPDQKERIVSCRGRLIILSVTNKNASATSPDVGYI